MLYRDIFISHCFRFILCTNQCFIQILADVRLTEELTVPMGTRQLFTCLELPELVIAAELCEDLWTMNPPSIGHAMHGATLIVNLSASDETTGKPAYRRELVKGQSARLLCGYIYASAGEGESSTDLVFGGHHLIAENGSVLAESERFTNETIYGDLDISVLKELPSGRQPVQTFAVTGKLRERAYGFIRKQLQAGYQGYIVCPMIDDRDDSELQAVSSYAQSIQTGAFADYRVGLLHGRMKPAEKDTIMQAFRAHEIDLLVSTTVIEVGVDVPNATILLIENAERFGLSQLHQLRGRVGRGSAQSYCILMTDHVTEDCRKRMQIMSRTTDGFRIAEADLQLRGAGDFFGQRQHGLPPLKVADLTQDTRLLQEVQQTARELLAKDPDLSLPENRALHLEVLRLFARSGENGRN